MTYEFLSDAWFAALDGIKAPELKPDDPIVNLIVLDSPYGEVKAHLAATRFAAGHRPDADATATVPYKLAREIFVEGLVQEAFYAVLHGGILGHIQVEGDYSMWAMVTTPLNGMLYELHANLKPITTPRPVRLLSKKAAERTAINAEIDRLGLQRHAREIEEQGYTLLRPEETGVTTSMMDRALRYVVDGVTAKTGVRPDMETGSTHHDAFYPVLWYTIFKDKVLQEMAANEHALALVAHLLDDQDFRLSTDDVLMKGPTARPLVGKMQLGLHFDTAPYGFYGNDEPLPRDIISVNALWLMTDFQDVSDGVTVFIPGTHKFRRNSQGGMEGYEHAVPIIAPRGSFLLWPGTTWHGAMPRTKPGMRVAMTIQYCAKHVHPRNPYQYDVTEEILRQNPPRFARLMGLTDSSGWRDEGIYAKLHERARAGVERYAKKPTTCSLSLDAVNFTRKKPTKSPVVA
jgi:Phytanoyl-CoA dioxygenase (PhyH)